MTDAGPDRDDVGTAWPSAEEIEARIAQLDFTAELEADGLPYSELDENGRIVTRNPRPEDPR